MIQLLHIIDLNIVINTSSFEKKKKKIGVELVLETLHVLAWLVVSGQLVIHLLKWKFQIQGVFCPVCSLHFKTVETVSIEGIVYTTSMLFMITKTENTGKLNCDVFLVYWKMSKFLFDSNFYLHVWMLKTDYQNTQGWTECFQKNNTLWMFWVL